MNTYQINERTNLLIKLHSIMICMNDENAYMEWIVTVLDEPTREDFEDIARDDKFFNEVLEEFMRIFNEYKDAEQKGVSRNGQVIGHFLFCFNVLTLYYVKVWPGRPLQCTKA